MSDARQVAPAAERNKWPILEVLKRVLPEQGTVVELACGTGQHAAFFSNALPGLTWQPSNLVDHDFDSVRAWGESEGGPSWCPPILLDAMSAPEDWAVSQVDAFVCINMIHISPWAACEGLLRGAGHLLSPNGVLVLYGPYRVAGVPTAPSNERFDQSLRARDSAWGLRQLEQVEACANTHGLVLSETVEMPANNLTVIFHRTPTR